MSTTPPTLPFDRPDQMTPPREYAELRPVARVIADGQPAWLVTSYDAVASVLSDPRFGLSPPGQPAADNDTLFQDGEPHARLRRLVGKAFTSRRIAELKSRVEQLADDHVAAMADAGPPADVVADLAAPMSITVIADLLGVAIDDRDRFRALADGINAADPFALDADPAALAKAMESWEELNRMAAGLVATKRESLGEDLLSALIAVRDTEDTRLSDPELIAMAATLVAAGYVTTTNAIAAGTVTLITEGRLATFGADDVEEILRTGSTAEPLPRWAHEDVELAGASIGAGDLVVVRLEAANRDPAKYADPDTFDPERPVPHVAFGRGPHHCLGAALARLELGAALGALAKRLPGLRLERSVDHIPWTRTHTDSGPTSVPVTW